MPLRWKLFRLVCLLQLLVSVVLAGYFATRSLMGYVQIMPLIQALGYVCIVLMASTAMQVVNNNYPDIPLEEIQKKRFNRLYLFNIFALMLLFAALFASWYTLRDLREHVRPMQLIPLRYYLMPLLHIVVLIFQFLMMYGLIILRRELASQQQRQQFDFETES